MLGRKETPSSFTKVTLAAGSAFAAKFIPKTFCGLRGRAKDSNGRSNGSRTGAEHLICRQSFARAASTACAPAIDTCKVAFLVLRSSFFATNGAYMRTHAATVPDLTARHAAGPLSRAGLPRDQPHHASQTKHLAALTAHPVATDPLLYASALLAYAIAAKVGCGQG